MESDLALLRPEGVSLHFTRMGGYDVDAVPDAQQMAGLGEAPLDEPLHLLSGARPDLIMYGCTSATLSHGISFDQDLANRIYQLSGAKTVMAASALVFALNSLGAKSIGFASPYTADINEAANAFLTDSGFEIACSAGVDCDLGNYGQGELSLSEVLELGKSADSDAVDAIVLSCTEMRSVEIISQLERAVKKPVVTSNQAMMYQACCLLDLPMPDQQFGQLLNRECRT
jgi:maleate isomerase/arylmalonate decarboxylase